MTTEKLDPLAPDALCAAVQSGCLHCILSVIVGREIAKGRDPADATGNLLQVAAEIANDTMEDGTREQTRAALLLCLGKLFDGDEPGAVH